MSPRCPPCLSRAISRRTGRRSGTRTFPCRPLPGRASPGCGGTPGVWLAPARGCPPRRLPLRSHSGSGFGCRSLGVRCWPHWCCQSPGLGEGPKPGAGVQRSSPSQSCRPWGAEWERLPDAGPVSAPCIECHYTAASDVAVGFSEADAASSVFTRKVCCQHLSAAGKRGMKRAENRPGDERGGWGGVTRTRCIKNNPTNQVVPATFTKKREAEWMRWNIKGDKREEALTLLFLCPSMGDCCQHRLASSAACMVCVLWCRCSQTI